MLCVQYVYLFVCAFLSVCFGHNLKQSLNIQSGACEILLFFFLHLHGFSL